MADHSYLIEVESDFLQKITRAKPVQAVAEFVWNGLDADATGVVVNLGYDAMGVMSQIIIEDNGTGMTFVEAPILFKKLGGSWKRGGARTARGQRFLHGQDGRGRFKAFSLGRVAEWDVTYEKENLLFTFKVVMTASNIKEVIISDETRAPADKRRGVIVTISELAKDYRSLTSDAAFQEITELFALYLTDYKEVSILWDSRKIDPARVIAFREVVNLKGISENENLHPARLEIIEWSSATNRALYLCNEKGMPLCEIERRFHIGSYQFSAYLKSEYIAKLQREGTLELAEMTPVMVDAIDEAQEAIKDYFRKRAALEARTVLEEWKDEKIYPYVGEAATHVEQVERQVFDIVATNVAQYLPDFSAAETKNKALHLRLLRHAIEKSPEELQLILGEVLKLPKRKQEELADLLRDVSLSAMISAAKIVSDRLKFLMGLEAILFDVETKTRLKERSQLHKIIAENCWLFGEEYSLSVSDRSLTEVLRKHRRLLGNDIVIDEPVKHISKERGIVDLMLSRAIRRHKADELIHLVVELKAPKVKIDKYEITQVEEYAISITKDERFKSVNTSWVFWAISDDFGDYAAHRITERDGTIHKKGNLSIFVKTWAQVLDENRARLQFFQERLEYEADKGASLKHLQERYAQFLEGVVVDESVEEVVES